MLVTQALKEECVVVVMVWSVLMLMLCSFLQFGICRALEYLISHLITPGQLSRDTPDQGRGWDFVKIFSISERLTQQWNISLWNYINSHHYVGWLLAAPLGSLMSHFLLVAICMWAVKLPCLGRVVPGQWAVQAGSPELPRHRGQSPVSSPSSAWRAFKQTICIQTLNFFFHALKFVPWVVLLFSHYDTFLGRQNFSHLPHKTLLQIQILKACYAIGNF